MKIETTCSGLKPGSTERKRVKLLMSSPAPTSSTSAKAISASTNIWRNPIDTHNSSLDWAGARRWCATRQSGAFAGWRPNRGWDDHIFATRLFSYTFRLCLERQPRELGEFVIVHELVHLLAPNHGKVFN